MFDLSSLASDKRDPYVALSDIRASQDIRSKDPMSCLGAGHIYPGYQRFFSRAAGSFGVGRRPTCLRPSAEATSGEAARKTFRAGHYKDLTETGNRARKVSGTQGRSYRAKEVKKQWRAVNNMSTPGLKTDRFPGICRVLQYRDSTALSAHHRGE